MKQQKIDIFARRKSAVDFDYEGRIQAKERQIRTERRELIQRINQLEERGAPAKILDPIKDKGKAHLKKLRSDLMKLKAGEIKVKKSSAKQADIFN